MNGTFKLEIRLGNDAMQTHQHIASALRELALNIDDREETVAGRLRDDNGNTVGEWSIVEDEKVEDKPLTAERRIYTVDELAAMPTIESGHFDNLKIEDGDYRVWLSRLTGRKTRPRKVSYQIRVGRDDWVDCDAYGLPKDK